MHAALVRTGEEVGRDRVARLMRADGLRGAKRRGKPWRTTIVDPAAQRRGDLVCRQFTAPAPDRLWVGEFTYLRCWEGRVHFSFVIDVFSRRVVGWQLAGHMRTTLVLDALRMALGIRQPGAAFDLVSHSDAGSQFISQDYQQQLSDARVLASIGTRPNGQRLPALIVLLWRAGLRISDALALQESDLDRPRGAVLVRHGKGGRRREDGGDGTRSTHGTRSAVAPNRRAAVGGSRADRGSGLGGRHRTQATASWELVSRRRFALHQLRHAHAVEMAHEGVPPVVIQRQLGHANLGITSIYLQGIDCSEIISTVHGRRSPTISATAGCG